MEFKKLGLGFYLLVILLLQLPLLHATSTTVFQEEPNAVDKEMPRKLIITMRLKRLVSVNRKGHGGGGHVGGHGIRARGHGTNEGSHNYVGSNFLLLVVLLVSFLQYFA